MLEFRPFKPLLDDKELNSQKLLVMQRGNLVSDENVL